MINYRLDIAKKYLDDAVGLFERNRFNSSASRAYYASYQAMWAALGNPKDGKIWRHLAIIKHFVRGYWIKPDYSKKGPGLLENNRLPLRRLYSYRIKSDYDGVNVDYHVLEQLVKVVKQIINIIEGKGDK